MKFKSIVRLTAMSLMLLSMACGNTTGKSDGASADINDAKSEQIKLLPEGAIPFDYAWHLYFDVILRDSIPTRMIFDTGNTNLLLDTEFYKQHFAPSSTLQRIVIQGTGNNLEGAYKDTSEWEYKVGEHSLTEQGAVVMNLRKILGSGADGMFGMEFMRNRKVEFNYTDGYMRILPQEAQPTEGYVCIKCNWLNDRHSRMIMPISVKINDDISFDGNFLVDMGSSGGLSINSSLAAKLKLQRVLTNVKRKIYDTGGVGGSRTDYIFKSEAITVGGNRITNMMAEFSGNKQGVMAESSYDGLVGNALLERFDVIFDFTECEIWLRPNQNINYEKKYDSGITFTPQNDCWIVNGLLEGGKAEKAGIKRGDAILSINGLAPADIDHKRLKELNASAEDWEVVVRRNTDTEKITFEKERF